MGVVHRGLRVIGMAGLAVLLVAAAEQPKSYVELVAQAEADDPATDFTALRHAYVQSDQYDGYSTAYGELREALWTAAEAKDCVKLISLSDQALKADYSLIEVHIHRKICFREMGNTAGVEHEHFVISGLTRSLRGSGDGQSPETAYVVVTMAEERMVLEFLDLDQQKQSLINKDGHNYDLIEGPNRETGKPMAVYFNVDAMFGSLMKKFGGAKEPGADK